jgi:hypothetical protein
MIDRLMRFSLISRCLMLLPATANVLLAIFAPESLSALLSRHEGPAQGGVLLIMAAIVSIGWLDVLINDFLPPKWQMCWAKSHRHLGYSFLAAVYLVKALASVEADVDGASVIVMYYVGAATLCAWYTWAAALRPHHAL